ncbi:LOW QUALITY PROTEIN: nucleolar complex protein 2 homolog [Gigantopelta aegis]|uniref:LOW QUALITY PROTEIN: nucleolar complex protein 2 homolog n=1 Tax=Gigantopelta aegis TaxID=1735272 RepID=UPI001B888135|nr:LOW QUALITY PROTEIN: nucleolar complex protein 2 homolog [Gigantopelta aegis]
MAKTKRKLVDMSVDEFMAAGLDTDSSSLSELSAVSKKQKEKLSKKMKTSNEIIAKKNPKSNKENAKLDKKTKSSKMKTSLAKLKEQDPEFYEFLQKEDKSLLEFHESDPDDDVTDDDDDDLDDDGGDDALVSDGSASKDSYDLEKELLGQSSDDSSDEEDGSDFHKLPEKLEVAGDISDDDDTDSDVEKEEIKPKKKGKMVTLKMVAHWTQLLENKPTTQVFREAVSAFKAAVHQASESDAVISFQVVGSEVFNAVVKMCLVQMAPVIQNLLQLPPLVQVQQAPTMKSKKWKMLRVDVKSYLTDLLQLLSALSERAMLNVILKHMHKLVVLYASFPKTRVVKVFLKRMVSLWSTGEETTRVLSFLCINKAVRILPSLLEPCMKLMYMAYVKNCKFTSPTTLPLINFMQRSLVEIFIMDSVLAYQYAFIYIRQLAIHLRNAITIKKKDTFQPVANWQYIHCLGLWVTLLCTTHPSDVLQPLVYPLTQTVIGTIKLLPTARYFPLRFHCARFLNQLSSSTGTFIPVLPFLLEVFELTDFNKKHSSVGFKPFNFACILKFSKTQVTEKGFKDGLVDQLYELLLEHFNVHAHTVGFPELVLPAVLQLKEFLKNCRIANYCKQVKQIIDKVSENSKFIVQRRKTATMNLSDNAAMDAWERQCKAEGTPLTKYYTTWRRLRDRELQHEIAGKERIVGDDRLPTVIRPKGPLKATVQEKLEFSKLFDQNSDDSDDDQIRFLPKQERANKKKRKDSQSSNEYSDFDSDEWEKLAGSADDNSDDDDDDGENDEATSKSIAKPKPQRVDNSGDKEDTVEDFVMSSDSE